MTAAQHILAIVQHDLQLIFLLRRCLENHGYPSFSVARNRDEAILYLRGVGIYGNRFKYPLPAALILYNPLLNETGYILGAGDDARVTCSGRDSASASTASCSAG